VTNAILRRLTVATWVLIGTLCGCTELPDDSADAPTVEGVTIEANHLTLVIDGLYYATDAGRHYLPPFALAPGRGGATRESEVTADGKRVAVTVAPRGAHYTVSLSADADADITGWGFAVEAAPDEYFTGLMERVVDGPQQASWAPGITEAMNLRGQQVDMIVKPTTSVYAPFYLSSRGYAIAIGGTWPGVYDFASTQPDRVLVDFEGPR